MLRPPASATARDTWSMSPRSTIYFPLRGNAAALYAGPGVAGVRRRILTAGLLVDNVVLESGLHIAWAGPHGGSTMTSHSEGGQSWQTPLRRGAATGATHYVAVRLSDSSESASFHPVVSTEASFSWKATFEPFRRELPASAGSWLDFGFLDDERPAQDIVRGWQAADRADDFRRYKLAPRPTLSGGQFVHEALLSAGYHDLAVAAVTGSAVSIDRRHSIAIQRRLQSGDAHRIGGHYALELLLPVAFSWDDVHDLRRQRALGEYRAILRDVEDAAMTAGGTVAEIEDQIRSEYQQRLTTAARKGLPFAGRAALQAIGFVLGAAADTAAPMVGGAVASAGGFALAETVNRAMRPSWLAIDRRLRGRRNGL